jgi:hypothetical protein
MAVKHGPFTHPLGVVAVGGGGSAAPVVGVEVGACGAVVYVAVGGGPTVYVGVAGRDVNVGVGAAGLPVPWNVSWKTSPPPLLL